MSIIGSSNYMITMRSSDQEENPVYVDNFENLRRTIATTWSKIPHRVAIQDSLVSVFQTDAEHESVLATFHFEPLPSKGLPDHF